MDAGKALKRASNRDDPLVRRVMRRAAGVLGHACLTARHLLDPEVIVIGGGGVVVEACGGFVMPIVEEVLACDALPGAKAGGKVVVSTLGHDAGVLGAVALAMELVGEDG